MDLKVLNAFKTQLAAYDFNLKKLPARRLFPIQLPFRICKYVADIARGSRFRGFEVSVAGDKSRMAKLLNFNSRWVSAQFGV